MDLRLSVMLNPGVPAPPLVPGGVETAAPAAIPAQMPSLSLSLSLSPAGPPMSPLSGVAVLPSLDVEDVPEPTKETLRDGVAEYAARLPGPGCWGRSMADMSGRRAFWAVASKRSLLLCVDSMTRAPDLCTVHVFSWKSDAVPFSLSPRVLPRTNCTEAIPGIGRARAWRRVLTPVFDPLLASFASSRSMFSETIINECRWH